MGAWHAVYWRQMLLPNHHYVAPGPVLSAFVFFLIFTFISTLQIISLQYVSFLKSHWKSKAHFLIETDEKHLCKNEKHLREPEIFWSLPMHDSYVNKLPQVEQTLQLIHEVHHSSVHIWLPHSSLVLLPVKKVIFRNTNPLILHWFNIWEDDRGHNLSKFSLSRNS